mgnify:CR=1 FL=1
MADKGINLESEIFTLLEIIEREKGLKREDVVKLIEDSFLTAYFKQIGRKDVKAEIKINIKEGKIEGYEIKKAVDEVKDRYSEISLSEARVLSPGVKEGDEVMVPIDIKAFMRTAAQISKQRVLEKIREIERESVYNEFKAQENNVVTGEVYRFQKKDVILRLGAVEGLLPYHEQIPGEKFNIGDRLRCLVIEIQRTKHDVQVILSRVRTEFVQKLLEMEVPEIRDKTVEILKIVREPGVRTKILVKSNNPKVDPVGACVGIRGSRIASIVRELGKEKIDLIPYSEDLSRLVSSALVPGKIVAVTNIDKENKIIEVVATKDQLPLIIGRNGQNVRLAGKLIDWEIKVSPYVSPEEGSSTSPQQVEENA